MHSKLKCHLFKTLTLTHSILHTPTLVLSETRPISYSVSSHPLWKSDLSLPWTTLSTTHLIRRRAREYAGALRLAFEWRSRNVEIAIMVTIIH